MFAGDFNTLTGQRVVIVEDEEHLAADLATSVRAVGGTVLGSVSNLECALALAAGTQVNAAVLDIGLGGDGSLPIATALRTNGVRVVFVAGYDSWFLPDELDA